MKRARRREPADPRNTRVNRPAGSAPPTDSAHKRFLWSITLSVVVASILGVGVAVLAAVVFGWAGRSDVEAVQQEVLRQQILTRNNGQVAEDVRLFAEYQDHFESAAYLRTQATRFEVTNPSLADDLVAQADAEESAAQALLLRFLTARPLVVGDRATFPIQATVADVDRSTPQLEGLHPSTLVRRADRLHDFAVGLVGAAILFGIGLFLLTTAHVVAHGEVTRAGVRLRWAGWAAIPAGVAICLIYWAVLTP